MNKSTTLKLAIVFGALGLVTIGWLMAIKEQAPKKSQNPAIRVHDLPSTEVYGRPNTPAAGVGFDAQELVFDKPKVTTQKIPKPLAHQIKDEALIAEIEQDMGFLPRPEGDLSYMSPENETVQQGFVDFQSIEPEDPNATLGDEVNDHQ
jgi:hypothetical protein